MSWQWSRSTIVVFLRCVDSEVCSQLLSFFRCVDSEVFQQLLSFSDVLIVKCFHKCVMSPGHFHCPYCDQQLYKRIAFAQHLKSHLKKMVGITAVLHSHGIVVSSIQGRKCFI